MNSSWKRSIQKRILEKFEEVYHSSYELDVKHKEDMSLLSEIDVFVSDLLKEKVGEVAQWKNYSFVSEEDINKLAFPAIVLDPIDGTASLVKQYHECVLSFAAMRSDQITDCSAWIFNPFTGMDIDSDAPFFMPKRADTNKLFGMVSRSEWKKGLFEDVDRIEGITLAPKGSIAYKLALLACGGCDFVITRRPKNIWDVAAGTSLCYARKIFCYNASGLVTSFSKMRMEGPLLWCAAEHYKYLAFLLE